MKDKPHNDRCIIFPHIPKCGGTSLKSQLENSGLNIYFDYDKPPHSQKFHQQACDRRNIEASYLDFSLFDIVFGHFPVCRYEKDSYQYITLLRHPVERAISHFFYWKNVLPESNVLALYRNPIISDIKKGTVNFVDFLKAKHTESVYAKYLCNKRPEDFLLVGFVEEYDSFLSSLSSILGISLSSDVRMRQGKKEELGKNEIEQATLILEEEIKTYEMFYKNWSR